MLLWSEFIRINFADELLKYFVLSIQLCSNQVVCPINAIKAAVSFWGLILFDKKFNTPQLELPDRWGPVCVCSPA